MIGKTPELQNKRNSSQADSPYLTQVTEKNDKIRNQFIETQGRFFY